MEVLLWIQKADGGDAAISLVKVLVWSGLCVSWLSEIRLRILYQAISKGLIKCCAGALEHSYCVRGWNEDTTIQDVARSTRRIRGTFEDADSFLNLETDIRIPRRQVT